jgi:hypothetical protein
MLKNEEIGTAQHNPEEYRLTMEALFLRCRHFTSENSQTLFTFAVKT